MAQEDRAASSLSREQRLAALVVGRRDLSPPIDVEALAGDLADVELDLIPGACDGVVVGLSSARKRPLIVIDSAAAPRRRRFTLAHEIGHVLLPWHVGTVACETGLMVSDPAEVEANRFAAELLVPSRWLGPVVARSYAGSVAPLLQEISLCHVSVHVAALRLVSELPTGWLFVLPNVDGTVELSARSLGTVPTPPRRGTEFLLANLRAFAGSYERCVFGARTVHWFNFGPVSLPDLQSDTRAWRDVLQEVTTRHSEDETAAKRLAHSISSIVGYAHGLTLRDPPFSVEKLLGHVRSRFAGRSDLPADLLEDPDFSLYLAKKADELADRR